MKTKESTKSTPQITLSHGLLVQTPLAAYTFLRGAANGAIARQLASVGYDRVAHVEGWTLFYAMSNAGSIPRPESSENVALQAIADIKAWNVQGFRRARAVLDRKFPDVSEFVFADIDNTNNGPVYELATFLDRLHDLGSATERRGTRKMDHAALEALASRGIGDVLFKQLRAWLSDAQMQQTEIETAPPDERTAAITELYLWLRDWRETARAVIKNKSQLRMLGIGGKTRKASVVSPVSATPGAMPTAPPVTVTPAASPAVATPIAQLPPGMPAVESTKAA